MAELVFHREGEPLLRVPVDRDRFSIGSAGHNHLVIPDEKVAEEEVRLELRSKGWWLVDASSRGALLDSRVVHVDAPLTDGAIVRLGSRWCAVFHHGDPTSPGETRRHMTMVAQRAAADDGEATPLRLVWGAGVGRKQQDLDLESPCSIGQDEDNTVALHDQYISAYHARIIRHRGLWRIIDLDSTNGTFVDGIPVKEAVLESGMELLLGETAICVESARDTPRRGSMRHGIVTTDPSLLAVLDQIERIARSAATVTLFGESGTGKELAARAVHDASDRATGPFIPVNCAAISKELMESELFGHEKGAFTGAASARAGAFEEAHQGTLFLDEIGELPLDLQAKLLRAIEIKELRRVGSSKPMKVDVRIVAATNRDLYTEVRAGSFREDLFYRLYVVPLTLPPLRGRPDDILLLAEHFLKTRSAGAVPSLTEDAKAKLLAHSWPGNVRELRNAIERALLFHKGRHVDAPDILFPDPVSLPPSEGLIDAEGKTLAEIERDAIRIALRVNRGNRRLTAQALGIARSTLQAKLKELGLLDEKAA